MTAMDAYREFTGKSVEEALNYFTVKEICRRLQAMSDVGLDYLTLDRTAATLSGGESQRINLATSLGSSLVGAVYVLDEAVEYVSDELPAAAQARLDALYQAQEAVGRLENAAQSPLDIKDWIYTGRPGKPAAVKEREDD